MQVCERCGKIIPDRMSVCPSCGTVNSNNIQPDSSSNRYEGATIEAEAHPQTPYGHYQQQPPSPHFPPNQAYQQPPSPHLPPNQAYQQPQFAYQPPPQPGPWYNPPPINVHVINNAFSQPQINSGALIVEVLLSMFGIYGVGWLISGKTTTGVLLLLGSIFLYWPLCIIFVVLTLGLGVFCVSPFAIAAIIINALLLNNSLKRQAQFVYMPPPFAPMPPQF